MTTHQSYKAYLILGIANQVSIVHPELLEDFNVCQSGFRGIHGAPTFTDKKGQLE